MSRAQTHDGANAVGGLPGAGLTASRQPRRSDSHGTSAAPALRLADEAALPASASSDPETSPPPDVLTVDELAALLRVERKTVYGAIGRGEIPGVRRIGAILRVSRDAVLTWLAQGQGRVSRSRKLQ